ncbi:MAG: antitoxin, partial [Nitrosomonas sp.]|nr:antitoxin [Nitrosomonas sp.]
AEAKLRKYGGHSMWIPVATYVKCQQTLAYALSYTHDLEISMRNERHVSLFRNGRSQAIRIPRDFELEGTEAIIRKEGDKLIIEPVSKKSLKELLAILPMLDTDFPEIVDPIVGSEDIF